MFSSLLRDERTSPLGGEVGGWWSSEQNTSFEENKVFMVFIQQIVVVSLRKFKKLNQ